MDYFSQSKIFLFLFALSMMISISFTGCNKKPSQDINSSILSTEDIKQIKEINREYTNGWLENDAEKVLGLYADSSIIIPSGLLPIQGIKAITEFWFPNDGSTTVIHYYDLDILEINGSSNLAYSYENGNLSFSYEKEDFRMERKAESYAITIYTKNEVNEWKIVKRIWTDLKN